MASPWKEVPGLYDIVWFLLNNAFHLYTMKEVFVAWCSPADSPSLSEPCLVSDTIHNETVSETVEFGENREISIFCSVWIGFFVWWKKN